MSFFLFTLLNLLFLSAAFGDFYNGYQSGNWPAPTLSNSTECVSGTDYEVTISNIGASAVVLTHHGGGIEANTSAISAALASLYRWNRYDFNAHGSSRCLGNSTNFGKLHITSPHFDDWRAVSLVSALYSRA